MDRKNPETAGADEPGYYDVLGQLGIPYFHFGGMAATERLVELCGVNSKARVLVVGCGTGYSACHIAKIFGCPVVGLDISEGMVAKAMARASDDGCSAVFLVADAYGMPFADANFDIVITEFVTQFLDKGSALVEYARVLSPGGSVGVNELTLDSSAPEDVRRIVQEVGVGFQEAVGLPLVLSAPSEWRARIEACGLQQFGDELISGTYPIGEMIRAFGGLTGCAKTLYAAARAFLSSKRLRSQSMKVGKLKNVMVSNRKTRRYIAAHLFTGKKPAR